MDTNDLLRSFRSQLESLVSGREDEQTLQMWLAQHVQVVADSDDAYVEDVVNTAWAMLSEYQARELTRDDFIDAIREVLTRLDTRQPAA